MHVLAMLLLAGELRIHLVDEQRRPVAARLEVHSPDGTMYTGEGGVVSRRQGRPAGGSPYLGSFVAKGSTVVQGPAGRYRVVAEHGLEYERVTREVDVSEGAPATVEIQLHPWIRMRERGWWSGDMHVHRTMEDTPLLLDAEDLNLGVVFTMWNAQNLWGDRPLPAADWIRQTGDHRWMTVTNAEDERGGGAWMLHGLREGLGLNKVVPAGQRATESWEPPGIRFVRQARKQKQSKLFPWFDLEKPIWWETPVMMALERPDSMGLLNNHYDQYAMFDNEAWARKRDTTRFAGLHGYSDYSLHLMYRYWNLGWLVPPSAGSASGVLPNPVGYNRMYVKLAGGFTVDKWYEGVRAGQVVVSNGPLVFVDWKRRTIEAMSRDELDRVEIIANGKVLQSWRPASKSFRSKFKLDLSGHSWVAARCYAKNDTTVRIGHTAPVKLNGKWDAREDARYFREWIEDLMRNSKGPRELYAESLAVYRARED